LIGTCLCVFVRAPPLLHLKNNLTSVFGLSKTRDIEVTCLVEKEIDIFKKR